MFYKPEDEFTTANLAVYPTTFAAYTKEILQSQLLMIVGTVQVEEGVMTVLLQHCENWSGLLKVLTAANNENISILARSPRDENDGFPLAFSNQGYPEKKENYTERTFS